MSIFQKIVDKGGSIGKSLVANSNFEVFYTRKFGYFLLFLDIIPRMEEIKTGMRRLPSELKMLPLSSKEEVYSVIAALSSSIFFWYWNVLSDCRNLNRRDILAFPMNVNSLPTNYQTILSKLGIKYTNELKKNSRNMIKSGLRIQTFEYSACKKIIDHIDNFLAKIFQFDANEADYIMNYDIKYRIGKKYIHKL